MHPDVVIVGAGSAGCVVAARLSSDPSRQVLLLEAGPDALVAEPEVAGPSFFDALAVPGRAWPGLVATRTDGSAPVPYARGRGVGGSGAVNAMVGIWGEPDDHDRWAHELGCAGWAWRDVEPVFRSLPLPLHAAPRAEWGPVDRALVAAAREAGHPWCADHRVPGTTGVGPALLTRKGGRRVSTADAYLAPARSRPNLVVRGDALVDRVLVEAGHARGVRLADGAEIEAGAVVLCAGALHTPALLLRSGVDRPGIGHGLKDHPAGKLALALREPADPHALAVATLCRLSSGAAANDLQILPLNHLGPAPEAAGLGMLMVALMRVHGSGRVRLAGPDASEDPIVELRLLHDERDLVGLRAGMRHLLGLCGTRAMNAAVREVLVDDRGTPLDALADDDALDALDTWLRATTGDYVHACGTCRMGAVDDPAAVVDPLLRVIGLSGLTIADASVLPDIPRANIHLTTVMVAERLARWFAEINPAG